MSLSISDSASGSTPRAESKLDHAISELRGVPNWCAVSLAMPTHTRFCSALLDALNTKYATNKNAAISNSCTAGKNFSWVNTKLSS